MYPSQYFFWSPSSFQLLCVCVHECACVRVCVCVYTYACDETCLYHRSSWVIYSNMGTSGYTTKRYIAPYPTKVQPLSSSLKWTVTYLAPFPTHKLFLVALPLPYWVLFLLPILSTNAPSYLKFVTVFCFVAYTDPQHLTSGVLLLEPPKHLGLYYTPLLPTTKFSPFFNILLFSFLSISMVTTLFSMLHLTLYSSS